MKKNYITLLLLIVVSLTYGQKFTISGYVNDKNTGETLIGANVIDTQNENIGTSTNAYGFYSLTLPAGKHIIAVSYLGYQTDVYEINLTVDTKHNFDLSEGLLMDEVVVTSTKDDARKNVESTQMGSIDIPIEEIKKLPVLFGEVDILKEKELLVFMSVVVGRIKTYCYWMKPLFITRVTYLVFSLFLIQTPSKKPH